MGFEKMFPIKNKNVCLYIEKKHQITSSTIHINVASHNWDRKSKKTDISSVDNLMDYHRIFIWTFERESPKKG